MGHYFHYLAFDVPCGTFASVSVLRQLVVIFLHSGHPAALLYCAEKKEVHLTLSSPLYFSLSLTPSSPLSSPPTPTLYTRGQRSRAVITPSFLPLLHSSTALHSSPPLP